MIAPDHEQIIKPSSSVTNSIKQEVLPNQNFSSLEHSKLNSLEHSKLNSSTDSFSSFSKSLERPNVPKNEIEFGNRSMSVEEGVSKKTTAILDRTNDKVYDATTQVVKAIMELSKGVQMSCAEQYLDLVKKVGMDLRHLLTSVDEMINYFPPVAHREIEMAHKVLSKDMADLVSAMRLAQQYSCTTLDAEYRR